MEKHPLKNDLRAYREALEVDYFLRQLTPFERMKVFQFHAGRTATVPQKVKDLQDYAVAIGWPSPEFLYNKDKLLVFFYEECWQAVKKMTLHEFETLFKIEHQENK